jgi:hypothetical protein
MALNANRGVWAVRAEESTFGLGCDVGTTSEFGFGDAHGLPLLVECQNQPVDLVDSALQALTPMEIEKLYKSLGESGARDGRPLAANRSRTPTWSWARHWDHGFESRPHDRLAATASGT